MPPAPDTLIEQIRAGSLLPAALFTDLDCDGIVDARGTDPDFEWEWLAAHENLSGKWEAGRPSSAARAVVDKLREEVFLAVFAATEHHDLSASVSDDFELIGWTTAAAETPSVVASLWESYSAGTIYRPDRRGR